MSAYEIIKLGVLVLGIGWCLNRGAHHALLCFIGFALGSDWLHVDLGPTATGVQILGLMFLPRVPRVVAEVLRTRGGRTFILGLLLLAVLAVVYGYLLPWPDKTGERPWSQRAEGRSIINLSATLSYASVTLYVASVTRLKAYRDQICAYLLIGTTVASIGVAVEVITRVDLFSILVPNSIEWAVGEGGRARGFNGEPRTSGSLAAMGIVMLLRPGLRRSPKAVGLLLLHALALIFTTSTLGLLLLVAGVFSLLVLTRRVDILAATVVVGSVALLSISAWFGNNPFELWMHYTGERLAVREEVIGIGTFEEQLVQSLEVFDASALSFLFHHPEHFIVGAGPGLVSLPASDYVPAGIAQAIFGDRIDSIPHMGVLRLVSDCGLVGLGLWLLNVLAIVDALTRCASAYPKDRSWSEARAFLLVFSLLFMMQTRATWYVWLGVGLAGSIVAKELEEQAAKLAKERRRRTATRNTSVHPHHAPGL